MEKCLMINADREMKLEKFLKTEAKLTEKQIRQAKFRDRGICVNGMRSRVTELVRPGDQVAVILESEETGSDHLVSWDQEVIVLYEDEDLIIVDKPARIVVHPSHGHFGDSIANMLMSYFRKQNRQVCIRAIGRLDKDTSGVLVFAKNRVAASRLAYQKEKSIFAKQYIAILEGKIEEQEGTITQPIGKMPGDLMKMEVTESGAPAVTHFQVLSANSQCSKIALRLETGRTHQIRVHMSWLGYPLVGDTLYGKQNNHMGRTALHAWKAELDQPFTGKRIVVEAPIPLDMQNYLTIANVI